MLLVILLNHKTNSSRRLLVHDLPFAEHVKEVRSIEPNDDWEIFGSKVIGRK